MSTSPEDDFELVYISEGENTSSTHTAKVDGSSPASTNDDESRATLESKLIQQAATLRTVEPNFLKLNNAFQKTADRHKPFTHLLFHAKLPLKPDTTLFDFFLSHIPARHRAPHQCKACRRFINKYGNLCFVNEEDGSVVPFLWPHAVTALVPTLYQNAAREIRKLFENAKVESSDYRIATKGHQRLGRKKVSTKDAWTHLHVVLTDSVVDKAATNALTLNASVLMLQRILADNSLETVNRTLHYLQYKLPYATPHKPAVEWLQQLIVKLRDMRQAGAMARHNILHLYARKAWTGCLSSLRGGVVGELLGWVKEGYVISTIEARWNALANPHRYLRPTSDPTVSNIDQAQKVFEELGYTREDLMRYWVSTDEIPDCAFLWKDEGLWVAKSDQNAEIEGEGDEGEVFKALKKTIAGGKMGHNWESTTADDTGKRKVVNAWYDEDGELVVDLGSLSQEVKLKKEDAKDGTRAIQIPFRHFARTVLPKAVSLEIYLEDSERFAFFTRGAPGSKSPFVFDSVDPSNTMSWYYWKAATDVTKASLTPGWNRVNGITLFPHMWDYLTPGEALDWEAPNTATEAPHPTGDVEFYLRASRSVKKSKGGQPPAEKRKWIHSRHGARFLFCIDDAMEKERRALSLFPTAMKAAFHGARKTVEAFSNSESIVWPHEKSERRKQVGGLARRKEDWQDILVRVTTEDGETEKYQITAFDFYPT
ncbi:hypothetical protein CC1G_07799 [Coprinopsis cinerea okayama7|uniref:Uncharacterized protein n=1 Tax=Coprinopsis cinerea (strain Okayama-7 / 130 / ATCC MYA-4618 / FGSC 9003) TaxID=240176 RepID=A8NP34_COPC7|nr:hypothetical protein CC1G_07799 [Coprinopsis cinerea okayama7\|eukprot:XP_001835256.1 hypothetical protein CC1G_07799 [Coprinopsis cinerea okayama7\